MSRKDRLIRQWIAAGDLPPEALRGGFAPRYPGQRTGDGSAHRTGMSLAERFAPGSDMAGIPYGTGEPDHGQTVRSPARWPSRALYLLVGLCVVVWATLAGAILYMRYLAS
jgi:hypothetical protein